MTAKDRCILAMYDVLDFTDCIDRSLLDSLDVPGNEQEMIRIDVTAVDKSPRLLGTEAGVTRVDQTALIVHKLVQVAASAGEALPEVVGRHLQDFTSNRVADTKDFAERKDQTLLAVQAEQHSGRAGDLGFFDQERAGYRPAHSSDPAVPGRVDLLIAAAYVTNDTG